MDKVNNDGDDSGKHDPVVPQGSEFYDLNYQGIILIVVFIVLLCIAIKYA